MASWHLTVAQVVRAYGALSFRSARSIQQLSRRLANLLADPEAQRTVTGAHIVAVAGVYPLLQLTWKDKHQAGRCKKEQHKKCLGPLGGASVLKGWVGFGGASFLGFTMRS